MIDPLDFLNYCDKATIIYPSKYPEKPAEYLEQIHRDVSKLLPELTFADFKFQVILDSSISDNNEKFYDFIVSLKSNGKTYRQKSSYHLYGVSQNKYFGNKIDQQAFYKIFNKILADQQSPYRLHEVKAYNNRAVDWSRFGIIALNKDQADVLHKGGVLFAPSYETFRNSLTSNRVNELITEYKKIGLFDHLTADQVRAGIELCGQQTNENVNDIIQCFPNVAVAFDLELENPIDPYVELTGKFSAISHGAFNPQNLHDNFSRPADNRVTFSFDLNGKEYSIELRSLNDWADPRFFELITQAVTDNKIKGQFYQLYEGGQGGIVIFLTDEQRQYLKANTLLLFAEDAKTVEE